MAFRALNPLDFNIDCSTIGFRWGPALAAFSGIEVDANAVDANECRQRCADVSGCMRFSFAPDGNEAQGSCVLTDSFASPTWDNISISGLPDSSCECPGARSDEAFPAHTQQGTAQAFASQRQPLGLECWPKDAHFNLWPCETTVLQDTEAGWPGVCLHLTHMSEINESDCEESCVSNPFCASWQGAPETQGQRAGCWQGVGDHCNNRDGDRDYVPIRAQRLQHGSVKVLANATSYQVLNLKLAFENGYFDGDMALATEVCKMQCYSSIHCQFWQYIEHSGCWIEDPMAAFTAGYPLVMGDGADEISTPILAGEYIQHYCDVYRPTPAPESSFLPQVEPAPAPETPSNINFMLTMLAVLMVFIFLACVSYAATKFVQSFQQRRQDEQRTVMASSSRHARGLQLQPLVEEPHEEATAEPGLHEPQIITTQSVLLPTYSAPPVSVAPAAVMYAAPCATASLAMAPNSVVLGPCMATTGMPVQSYAAAPFPVQSYAAAPVAPESCTSTTGTARYALAIP